MAPGNPGFKGLADALPLAADDISGIGEAARRERVDLVVVGPEAPLAAGLADRLAALGIPCFGPTCAAARLESSKAFAKEIAARAGAPSAAFARFTNAESAKAQVRGMATPYVVKADGLAAGKGVVIAETLREADAAIDDMLSGGLGPAGAEIVIEEFMAGEEASYFVLADGEEVLPLAAAQDFKRAFDGDKGPNTGGMGACSPTSIFTKAVEEETLRRIVRPVLRIMSELGTPYRGVLFAGLMIGADGPKLVEFNARFGDPECQALMRRVQGDFLAALHACASGRLREASLSWSDEASAVVVMAADGYPGAVRRGSAILGVERANASPGVVVFQAGTEERDGRLLAAGGRVLSVSATAPTLEEAVARAYAGVDAVDWPGGFCRRDIGRRALGIPS